MFTWGAFLPNVYFLCAFVFNFMIGSGSIFFLLLYNALTITQIYISSFLVMYNQLCKVYYVYIVIICLIIISYFLHSCKQ